MWGVSPTYPDGVLIGETRFDFVSATKQQWRPGWIPVRKSAALGARYLELSGEFAYGNIVELGIDRGASTAYLLSILHPTGLVAIDINTTIPDELAGFLDGSPLAAATTLGWGVDQTDGETLARLLEQRFGEAPLDLIIDDASHAFAATVASFEILFPRLRPGGLYLIEDWAWFEQVEAGLIAAIEADPSGGVARTVAERARQKPAQTPLSRIAALLALAGAYSPEVIAGVTLRPDWIEVRRGPARVPDGLRLPELISPTARGWLDLG